MDLCANNSQWTNIPDIIVEKIFSYLPLSDRYRASLVCKRWSTFFNSAKVWSHLVVDDKFLSHISFNYHSGWQYVLDNERLLHCMQNIGHSIRYIHLQPIFNFTKLYQFLIAFTWYIRNVQQDKRRPNVKGLSFVFPCDVPFSDNPNGVKLFGIGGQLVASLKQLCSHLPMLSYLELIDLVLQRYEANHLMDEVSRVCSRSLCILSSINITTVHCPLLQIGLMDKLKILKISPQNINDDLLRLIVDSGLKELFIVQNSHTPINIMVCSQHGWEKFKNSRTSIRVHLIIETNTNEHIEPLIQPNAPIHSIWINSHNLMKIDLIETYSASLKVFGQTFNEKSGIMLLETVKVLPYLTSIVKCNHLTALSIRDNITTRTVLLIATLCRKLEYFYVRRESITVDCTEVDNDSNTVDENSLNQKWIMHNSNTIAQTEISVSKILGKEWKFLNDDMYKKITLEKLLNNK